VQELGLFSLKKV